MHLARIWALLLCCGLSAAHADTFISLNEGTEFQGSAGTAGASERQTRQIWVRADRMTTVDTNGRTIGRLDRGESYLLNNAKDSCLQTSLKQYASDALTGAASVFQPTGETRQVGPWTAVGYKARLRLDGGTNYTVSIWVSDEVTTGLDDYLAYTRGSVTPANAWAVESLSLGGYPVRQEIHIGSTVYWMEITSVEQKEPPPHIYDVPDGYAGCE